MKKLLASLLIATTLAGPAMAFTSTNNDRPVTVRAARGDAEDVLNRLNTKGRYAAELYRTVFLQVMGLVFFDPMTPDIGSCQRDILNYHLPQLTNTHLSYGKLQDEIIEQMTEVYTTEELQWMAKFYATPFGDRMLRKQVEMNDRITRLVAAQYGNLKPQFQDVYKTMAARCGSALPISADTPKLSNEILMPSSDATTLPPPKIVP